MTCEINILLVTVIVIALDVHWKHSVKLMLHCCVPCGWHWVL